MTEDKKSTPGMPDDGLTGAPDGVNTQGDEVAEGARKSRILREGRAKSPDDHENFGPGWFEHGGQSAMGYHGPQQLGDEEVRPGGNPNSGSKTG